MLVLLLGIVCRPQEEYCDSTQAQKWNLHKSACDDGFKIELRPVLTIFEANLSFPSLRMKLTWLLSTLKC